MIKYQPKILTFSFSTHPVTILTFDLTDNSIPNANTYVKAALLAKGWKDTVSYRVCKWTSTSGSYCNNGSMPSTTLWKEGIIPEDAVKEFYNVLDA